MHRVDSSRTRLPRTILSGRVQRDCVIASYYVLTYWALCIDVWHQTGAHVGHAASREQSSFPHQKTDAELKNAPGNPFWSFWGCLVEVIHSYWHTRHANLPVTFSFTFIVCKFHYSQHWLCVFCIIPIDIVMDSIITFDIIKTILHAYVNQIICQKKHNPPTRFGVHSLLFLCSIQNFVTRCPSKIPSPKSKIQDPQKPKSKIQNPQNPKSPKSKIPKFQNPNFAHKDLLHNVPKSKIPKIPKIQNPQNPKSPKSKIPKIPKAKIQNPHNPKSKIPKIPKIQNPKSPKSKIQAFLAGFWGFWI